MNIFGAIQFCPRLAVGPADIKDNFRRMESLIHRASEFGVGFLVFPELCLTGYSFLTKKHAYEVCELDSGTTLKLMRGVAQDLHTYVSYGYVEADTNGHLYNSATLLDPRGNILTKYRKINLFSSDFLWATPGMDSAPVVDTEFGKTSIVVCRDLRDKIPDNIPRIAAKSVPMFSGEKIDLVAASVNWGKSGYPANTWMDFVADNRCTLIVANRWGKESVGSYTQDFGQGGSMIIGSDWHCHTNGSEFNQDCLVVASIEE